MKNKNKLVALGLCLVSLWSANSLASGKYTTQPDGTGFFVVPDVNVDDKSYFDSVTVQFNWANNTFQIVNAKPKSPTVSSTPIQSQDVNGLTVGLLGCEKSGTNQVTCHLQIVNNEPDRDLYIYGNYLSGQFNSLIFDNLNNTYKAASVTYADTTAPTYVKVKFFQGVPTKVNLTFTGINVGASSISTFKPLFSGENVNTSNFNATFTNINF